MSDAPAGRAGRETGAEGDPSPASRGEGHSRGAAATIRLAALVSELRSRGARVGTGELIAAQRALAAVDPAEPDAARLALRATLCSSRADLALFDAAFAAWAAPAGHRPEPLIDPVATAVLPRVAMPVPGEAFAPDPGAELRPAAWSEVELLRDKDFSEYSERERAIARTIMRRIAARGPRRLSRRTRASRRRSHRPDPRATLRASLRHAGEPFERRWRAPTDRPRPLVLVCDVSGSMEPYSRMLLQYAQACVAARRRCEAFALGTRLTRVTGELRGRDPDLALRRATEAVADWSGGTRIGDALGELNRVHGRRIGRGAVIVILSDGWDRGDPELLRREIARLGRCAHRLVWLNPLKASPGYEPLTRGMVAALPHVDAFLAGNSLASLEELAGLLEAGIDEGAGR
ncbi:MAG TPA: VWA domain-containing protein [Solirubrobacterales bacterium]|nr:VWA domain-containing protein [Solirubrobacterales bacterium]